MTRDYDNVTTRTVREVVCPAHVLYLLDHLLTAIDKYDATAEHGSIQSQRDDVAREATVDLYNETMGAYLPPEYAELLHEEAGQLIGTDPMRGPVSMALRNLNLNGWDGIEDEPVYRCLDDPVCAANAAVDGYTITRINPEDIA